MGDTSNQFDSVDLQYQPWQIKGSADMRSQNFPRGGRIEFNVLDEVGRIVSNKKAFEFKEKWFQFFMLLAEKCSQPIQGCVNSAEVACLPNWSSKTPIVIGKQIARYIDQLHAKGLPGLVVWRHKEKTKEWMLALSKKQIKYYPSKTEALRWLETNRYTKLALPVTIQWIENMVLSFIKLQEGNTIAAYETAMAGLRSTDSSFLKKISIIWARRAFQRNGPDESWETQLDEAFAEIPSFTGVWDSCTDARLLAISALSERHDGSPEALKRLAKYSAKLEASSDPGGSAILQNTMGVLAIRVEDYKRAAIYLNRAVALSFLASDLLTLQAALFNLGHCILKEVYNELKFDLPFDSAVLQEARRYLEFDRKLRTEFNLGRDSAQTELLLAKIDMYLGRLKSAEDYFVEARHIVEKGQNEFENGVYCRGIGQLYLRQSLISNDKQEQRDLQRRAKKQFEKARRMFERIGDLKAIESVREDLLTLARYRNTSI